jgi:hypothetical protein
MVIRFNPTLVRAVQKMRSFLIIQRPTVVCADMTRFRGQTFRRLQNSAERAYGVLAQAQQLCTERTKQTRGECTAHRPAHHALVLQPSVRPIPPVSR